MKVIGRSLFLPVPALYRPGSTSWRNNNTQQHMTIPRYNFSDEVDYTFGSHDFIIFFPTVETWLILHVCIARARPTNQTQIKNLPCKTCLNSVQIRLKLRWTSTGRPFLRSTFMGKPFFSVIAGCNLEALLTKISPMLDVPPASFSSC